MTRRRWWSVRDLGRIRTGVLMGMYHQSAHYMSRYTEILYRSDKSELGLYERGLLRGYESRQRHAEDNKFKNLSE